MKINVLAVSGALISAVGGAIAGYFFAKNQLEKAYDEALSEEIEATKRHYAVLNKVEFDTPADAVEALRIPASMLKDAREVVGTIVAGARYGTPGATTVNVFENLSDEEDADKDYSEEDAKRSKDRPYVISREEFFEHESNLTQITLTYFAGDDVVVDEADMPMDDIDNRVGEGNLDLFGHRSGDPRVVYIRNEKNRVEYEVCLSDGNFAEEVAGFLKHSNDGPKIRKFRKD